MVPVVVCGENKKCEDRLVGTLSRSFSKYGNVIEYRNLSFTENQDIIKSINKNSMKNFIIYELPKIPIVNKTKGILIFKNSFKYDNTELKLDKLIPIVDDQNKQAISILSHTGTSAISCGMAMHNTLSIASIDENNAIISLQRDIKTLSDSIIEPHDFPVYYSKRIDVFSLLAVSAVLLLSNIDSSNGYNL